MNADSGPVLSATVWVVPASRRDPSELAITADNVAEIAADPGELRRAEEYFRSRGFEVAPPSGPMFSITAPEAVFESVFGAAPELAADGGLADEEARERGLELPLDRLPAATRALVWRVVVSPTPSYHEAPDEGGSFDY